MEKEREREVTQPIISFTRSLFFFMNDHCVLLSLSNTSSHCPCRQHSLPELKSVWFAVCRQLCVVAVELADGLRITNQPRLPHRSANEPKHLIRHSAGVHQYGSSHFSPCLASFRATHLSGNSTLRQLCNA